MSREGQTIAYSAAEAAAIQAVHEERNAFHNALDILAPATPGVPSLHHVSWHPAPESGTASR